MYLIIVKKIIFLKDLYKFIFYLEEDKGKILMNYYFVIIEFIINIL